ncbi:MAG: FAD-dependent oxidoreductase, partial [Candidatus Kryptonium sp.]
MNFFKRKIIVIGGSAAGPAAAAKAKRTNPDNEIILYEAGDYISIGTCEIPYVLSGEVESLDKIIFFSPETFEKEKGVKVKIRHRVESIDKHKKKIYVRDLQTQKVFEDDYDKLIQELVDLGKREYDLRLSFYKELRQILTEQQIAQVIVFERNFRREFMETVREMQRERMRRRF